jgi:hypothetical protein
MQLHVTVFLQAGWRSNSNRGANELSPPAGGAKRARLSLGSRVSVWQS